MLRMMEVSPFEKDADRCVDERGTYLRILMILMNGFYETKRWYCMIPFSGDPFSFRYNFCCYCISAVGDFPLFLKCLLFITLLPLSTLPIVVFLAITLLAIVVAVIIITYPTLPYLTHPSNPSNHSDTNP